MSRANASSPQRSPFVQNIGGLVDSQAAADFLAVPVSWVRNEARHERIPHRRLGKYVRFSLAELDCWQQTRRFGPRVHDPKEDG